MTATLPPDPYKILGVSKDAQLPEIRSSYRKLVLKCHPDKVQDPHLKEQKQIEFQRVQQAYELLINEVEREKYDKLAEYQAFKDQQNEKSKNTAPPVSSNRSPKRETPTFYDVKEASPRPTTFAKPGPYGRTPPRSYEDNIASRFEEVRQARKAASYEKEKPSRREEERRRKEKDDEWSREKEKEKDRVKEKEKKEKAREDKDRREKEKERDRRDKDRKKSSPEKERRRDSDEKRRAKQPYVEVSPEENDEVLYSSSYKSDKKKSSSRRHEEPVRERDTSRPPVTDRERKNSANMESAIRYMQRSGGLPPTLARAHTFQEESFSRHTPVVAVPTPPPATNAVYPPPPKPEDRDITVEEDPRRPAARGSGRRMSFSKEKTHKKSGASREPPVMSDPESPPRPIPQFKKSHSNPLGMHSERVPLARANTEGYSRPIPGSMDRSQTWYGADHNRERSRSRHGRHERAMALSEEDSDDERDHRHRHHGRRAHSPVNMQGQTTIRYAVDKGKSFPVRPSYPEETPRGYKSKGTPTRIERGTYPQPSVDAYEDDGGAYFSKVKYAPQYGENEIAYSAVPHSSYRAEGLYT
ncbi:hypothetical protein F5X96DRAFT_236114 [Biscogniauxia mediterranea]|nr:hypothetical protein F5X96DRAFT_236114 [Biscogniauxia mediterranea]